MKHEKRFISIDLLKGIGIVLLVLIHIGMYLTLLDQKRTSVYQIIIYLAMAAAPIFLTAVGINLVISAQKHATGATAHILKRGLALIVIGLLFTIIWHADIIHIIGIFLILAYFLLSLSKALRALIAVTIVFCSPLLLGLVTYADSWQRVAYHLNGLWTLSGFLNIHLISGFYPIFPWLAFVITGTILGEYLVHARKKDKEIEFMVQTAFISSLMILAALVLHMTGIVELTFYPASITYLLMFTGVSLLLFSLLFWLLDYSKKFKTKWIKALQPLAFLGKVSLSIYLLHVLLGLSYFLFTETLNTFQLLHVILYAIGVLAVTGLICYASVKIIGNGPFEYVLKKFTS